MKERVKMKDGRLFRGAVGGSEGGLLYLFDPEELNEDETGELEPGNFWEKEMGVKYIRLPIIDIEMVLGPASENY